MSLYSEASADFTKAMKKWKAGTLHSGSKKGPIVKSQDQALAIAFNAKEKKKETVGYGGLAAVTRKGLKKPLKVTEMSIMQYKGKHIVSQDSWMMPYGSIPQGYDGNADEAKNLHKELHKALKNSSDKAIKDFHAKVSAKENPSSDVVAKDTLRMQKLIQNTSDDNVRKANSALDAHLTAWSKNREGLFPLEDPAEDISEDESFDQLGIRVIEVSAPTDAVQKATVILISAGPGNKVHKHWYSNKLLEGATAGGMFEGKQCYGNHPSRFDQQNRPERDINDLLGFFKNARIQYETVKEAVLGFKPGDKRANVVADFYPEIGKEFVMEKLRTAAMYNKMFPGQPGYIGWSIVAGGSSKPTNMEGEQWKAVTDFSEIDSIDMVTRAGAGGRLLNFMEARMKLGRLFGGRTRVTENDQKPDVQELRTQLSNHVVESLGKAGIKPTSVQSQLIEAGLSELPSSLLTPNFILTAVSEAGVEVDEEKLKKLSEALGVDDKGKLTSIIKDISEADDMEADVEEEEEADPSDEPDDDPDDSTDKTAKEKKEARKKAEEKKKEALLVAAVKDASQKAFVESVIEERDVAVAALVKEKELRKVAESQNKKSLTQLRETNARTLLAKSKLTEAQKEAIFEDVACLPTGEQGKQVSKYETLLTSNASVGAMPGRGIREAASGKAIINAMRD